MWMRRSLLPNYVMLWLKLGLGAIILLMVYIAHLMILKIGFANLTSVWWTYFVTDMLMVMTLTTVTH